MDISSSDLLGVVMAAPALGYLYLRAVLAVIRNTTRRGDR